MLANDDPIIIEGLRALLTGQSDRSRSIGTFRGDPEIQVADDLDPPPT